MPVVANPARNRPARTPVDYFTAVALFDQSLDAEKSLAALQREELPAEAVSVIIRDRASSSDRSASPVGDVARALVASAMGPLGSWLRGLASLIVAERGTYLVAGLMGASLATLSIAAASPEAPPADLADEELSDLLGIEHEESDALYQNLVLFGLTEDDASYLENRLVAGTSLVAITSSNRRMVARARNEFDAQGAVFLRVVLTDDEIVRLTRQRLSDLSEARSAGHVVVADAVAPLRRICHADNEVPGHERCGLGVADAEGQDFGEVTDLLADPYADDQTGAPLIRYAVVGYGGLFGLGRRHVALPIDQLDFEDDRAVLRVGRDVVTGAPRYDRSGAFSRREELGVLAYFGVRPYWLDEGA